MGRMPCFGLAAAGASGCLRVLELLEDEIRICLALLGVDRLSALGPQYVHAAPPVGPPSVVSAFPLLDGAEY
jgi:glycolate oxidase